MTSEDIRQERRSEVMWRLIQIGPNSVYRMLVTYAKVHKKTAAWVRANLCAIFSYRDFAYAEPNGGVEPLDFHIIEEWLAYR